MQRHKNLILLLAGILTAALCSVSYVAFAADADGQPTKPVPAQYAYIADRSVYFYDVAQTYSWAFHEIDYLSSADIIQGTDNYLFEPEAPISRADYMLMLYRAYDMSAYRGGQNFADVPADAYYAEAVLAAKNLGIANGDAGGFQPDTPITREDAMVLLARTVSRTGIAFQYGDLSAFADGNQVSDYARGAVSALIHAGIVGGDQDGIRPKGNVSRAEMAVMLYRSLMLQSAEDGVHYKAHPERVNLCIGDQVYSGVVISNFEDLKTYQGLMKYTAFSQSGDGHTVEFSGETPVESQIRYADGVLEVDGQQTPLAADCVSIRVQPYSVLKAPESTGEAYRAAVVSYNADGEAAILYYLS
ncbi:MAG: S-layer homology domain-containing protein [Intestinibacillus sp.]